MLPGASSVKAGLAVGAMKAKRKSWGFGSGCCPFSFAEEEPAFSVEALAKPGELGAGWLMKKGRKVPTKKRRFFVLRVGALEYFEDESRATLKGVVPLWPRTAIGFVKSGPDAERAKLRVKHPEMGEERDLYAASHRECEAWVLAIEAAQATAKSGGAREGRLHKRGGWTNHDWQPRWCVFDGVHTFRSYHHATDDRPSVTLDLSERGKSCRALAKVPSGAPGVAFELAGFAHPFVFACETTGSRNAWVDALGKGLATAAAADEEGETPNPLVDDAASAAAPPAPGDASPAAPGPPPQSAGPLERRTRHALYRDGWRRRHYALGDDGVLREYATEGEPAPLFSLALADVASVDRYAKRDEPRRFSLKRRDGGRSLKLRAADARAADAWIASLAAWVHAS